jgi:hypothetical protein
MKSILSSLLFASLLLFGATGCDDDQDDQRIDIANTPVEIETYVDTYFPGSAIINVRQDVDDNEVVFEVLLEGDIQLEFDEAKQIMEIESATALPEAVIPVGIRDYVYSNYADRAITDWELENGEQAIELDNELELVFDLEGNFLRLG